jgi:hypothetical protein
MNKKLLLSFFSLFCAQLLMAQSSGFNSSYTVFSINGGANTFYCMFSNTSCGATSSLNGANLGSFDANSNTLVLKGAEHNVFKCGGANITATTLNYRIYLTSTPSGSFTAVNIAFGTGSSVGNGCSGADQKWQDLTKSINVLAGLAVGNYTIEIYSNNVATSGNIFLSNSNNNYKATFTVNTALSVELSQLSAKVAENTNVLQWITASEKNNAAFAVQRSQNGRDFTTIGTVKGNGTTNNTHNYHFADETPLAGLSYYRLAQTDFDGTTTNSKVVTVARAGKTGFNRIYPTNVQSELMVEATIAGAAKLSITDAVGRQVLTQNIEADGFTTQTLNVSALVSGVYFLTLEAAGMRNVEKFVKQ